MKYITLGLAFLFLICCAGCRSNRPAAVRDSGVASSTESGDIKIEDGAGTLVMKLKKDGTDYTVVDEDGTLGKLKVKEGRVTINDAEGTKIGSVKKDGADLVLDDADGKKIVKLGARDGGYRLKDNEENTWLKIKPKDDGFGLNDAGGNELGKVKGKGSSGKLKIMDAGDKTRLVIAGQVNADVAGVLIVKQLTPLQQAAFLVGGGL